MTGRTESVTGAPNWTRRDFVRAGAVGVLLTVRRPVAAPGRWWRADKGGPARLGGDPQELRELALRAVGAAREAGATYADIRLTRTETQRFSAGTFLDPDQEELAVGVRALKDGYWGFSASPYWETDEVVRLARDAVEQAKTSAVGAPRNIDWGEYPVASGDWATPVRIDPFSVPVEEKIDFMRSWLEFADQYGAGVHSDAGNSRMSFRRQLRAFATTEGAYCTQTLYRSDGEFGITVGPAAWRESGKVEVAAKGLSLAGRGWEMFLDAKLRDQVPRLAEEGEALRALVSKPVELGRFDVVLDGETMASLVDCTIGTGTELDRASGSNANDVGTSYLAPPLSMVGTCQAASPLVTITANRSEAGGLATVKWDDDGVEPDDFAIVERGVLVDYQTTRESAAWLAPYYQAQHRPVRSHGCAGGESATSMQILQTANLAMLPGADDKTLEQLVAGVQRGVLVCNGSLQTDSQANNGTGPEGGIVREIRNGQLGAVLSNAGFVFSALELWRNVAAVGGARSVEVIPVEREKGRPVQPLYHTVSAPAAVITNVAILDRMRR